MFRPGRRFWSRSTWLKTRVTNQPPPIRHSPFVDCLPRRNLGEGGSLLANRRLHLGFVHRWYADRLTFLNEPDLAMCRESRSRRNQVTHDHVLFESAEAVHFA